MSREPLNAPRHNYTIGLRTRRRKAGFSTVVSAAIMIGAIAVLGSAMLIWGTTVFNAKQKTIGNTYQTSSNLLKENFIFEDVWLNPQITGTWCSGNSLQNPVYVNVTLRNIGNEALNVTQVQITGLKSDGSTVSSVTATRPFTGDKCTGTPIGTFTVPSNSRGLIAAKAPLRIDVPYNWGASGVASLNIQVTTARGSVQSTNWQVS